MAPAIWIAARNYVAPFSPNDISRQSSMHRADVQKKNCRRWNGAVYFGCAKVLNLLAFLRERRKHVH